MKTYLAILRGINVNGQKKIPMAGLKSLFEDLNCTQVKTYIQSGNIVFNQEVGNQEEQIRQIEKKIVDAYSFQVPVLIRSQPELAEIAQNNPFLKEKDIEIDKLHVTFLADIPSESNRDKLKNVTFGSDRFIIVGKDVYVYCPGGYGNTKLSNTFFENKLKVTATTRNWRTVNELYKMVESTAKERLNS
ncbi:DUF1697 domain-containing protein [Larkinella rosea]|uniref:DUF1697 domain-containing protein n=1 Tax=Larkinella rosea TaxID=2025312 RepID=A0A3P1BMP5_9BACT|nr:DUF1697 domain-containing protein [Larkinella rosea]RRB02322.1 DUF1697 domain-containing protein [Larkinella rosea]